MNYSNLEEAYGTPFGQRIPVTHIRNVVKPAPPPKEDKHKKLVEEITASLPLDQNPATESFRVPPPVVQHEQVREHFSAPPEDKLSRILRLIEQNKTGYERPATQDMVLYVFTGVFFLFTLDTFVLIGKSMRGK